MDDSGCFEREFELENPKRMLTFRQKVVGDVSCVIWDASLVLARYLEKRAAKESSWIKGNAVLELGSGVGCAGIVAACLGAHVTLTDLPEVLPLLEHNIAVNHRQWSEVNGHAQARELKWGKGLAESAPSPKLLLVADCVYYSESVKPLVETMYSVTSSVTEVLVCQELRDSDMQANVWENFMTEVLNHFTFTKIPLDDQHPIFRSSDIILLKGSKIHHA